MSTELPSPQEIFPNDVRPATRLYKGDPATFSPGQLLLSEAVLARAAPRQANGFWLCAIVGVALGYFWTWWAALVLGLLAAWCAADSMKCTRRRLVLERERLARVVPDRRPA